MCSWQVVERMGPWAWPLMTTPHWPQMPSRQSESKATGSLPWAKSCSLSRSRTSRKLMCSSMSDIEYVSKYPLESRFFWRQILSLMFTCNSAA